MSWIEQPGFETYGSFNLTELGVDEAWLNICNGATIKLWLYQQSKDCFGCPYELRDDVELESGNSTQFKVSTKFPFHYRFRTDNLDRLILKNDLRDQFCDAEFHFGEFGIYDLNVQQNKSCRFDVQLQPVNVYLPILLAAFFYIALGIICTIWKRYEVTKNIKNYWNSTPPIPSTAKREDYQNTSIPISKSRLRSLDTFRGLSIVIMIFVNDGGADYYFTEHATWDGLHIADLVFPWFLWVMGVCIPISIKSQLKRQIPKSRIFRGIFIRSLKLIGIGLILASKSGPIDFTKLRLPGVLQRFGLCYFTAASTLLICAGEDLVQNNVSVNKWIARVQDITFIWKGWLISLAILCLHTALTFWLPVDGCPTGYLGPGGLHDGNAHASNCIGGAAGYLDRKVLTPDHIYKYPTALFTYKSEAYDPEGLLGTLTSIFQVWLGVQAGMTLQVYQSHPSRLLRWSFWAILYGILGTALCGAKQTGGFIPINKNLWSLSYVLVTSCFSQVLLTLFYIIVDIKKWWSGSPFVEPGMNSILLYVGHSLFYRILPFHFTTKDGLHTHFLKLVESLWGTSLWVSLAIYLHEIQYFWSL